MDAFGLGALIACFPLPRAKQQVIVLSILLPVAALIWQWLSGGSPSPATSLGYPFIMPTGYQFVWGYTALNYYFAVLICAVAREGFLTRILETPVLAYLGRISYGLYVYHNGVIWFAGRIRDLGVVDPWAKHLSSILALIVTFLLAALTYRYVERPFLKLKDRFFPAGLGRGG
jgi:peptidoglycan/LPS O-acetylase OafA/YrhL